jgi:hypothetical protein
MDEKILKFLPERHQDTKKYLLKVKNKQGFRAPQEFFFEKLQTNCGVCASQ